MYTTVCVIVGLLLSCTSPPSSSVGICNQPLTGNNVEHVNSILRDVLQGDIANPPLLIS